MYKTISNEIIRSINSKSNLLNIITDENEELPIKDWVQKYRKVVPAKDILWLLLREEFMSEKDLILFAVWCAREALKLIADPDERSVETCNVVERYANGEATQEELLAARDAADDATDAAYSDAADAAYATRAAAYASSAAYYASYAAYYASYFASYAASTAAFTVSHDASIAASYAANDANAAVYAITRDSQLDKLLTYFE
jgi:hypothetical protein